MSENGLPPLDPHLGSWDEAAMGRRRFLEFSFFTVSGLTGLIVGGAAIRLLVGESLEPPVGQWVEVGRVVDLPPGQMHQTKYKVRRLDAWREVEKTGIVYTFSANGNDYVVLDGACSHLGCNVRWQDQAGVFACPCHNGRFTQQGKVVAGPPPAPLRQLQTKLENGILMALI